MNKLEEKFINMFMKAKTDGNILPCPCCGSTNLELEYYHGLVGIHCKDCYVPSVACYKKFDIAVKKWNEKRTPSGFFWIYPKE